MKHHGKINKVIVVVLITALLAIPFSYPTTAISTGSYDFANFTEADSMAFVEQCNIEIPEEFFQLDELPSFTQKLILQSYNNPNVAFCFNYSVTQAYAEEIRAAVCSWMNLDAVPAVASSTSYSLQYNTVMDEIGNWVTCGGYYNPKWRNYNCYAYAINRAEQPAFYSTGRQYQPGDMCGEGSFVTTTTIDELAHLVANDLVDMGYSNVFLFDTIPTIDSTQELICVRRYLSYDYHFMHYDIETDAWYHKPGITAVLKYNDIPSNYSPWYAEYSDESGEYPLDFAYNSDIVFITYSKNQINVDTGAQSIELIQPGKDVFCEINFQNSGSYNFEIESTYSVDYELYDQDFDILLSGTGTAIDTSLIASAGKYYLRISFVAHSELHHVDVTIRHQQHTYTYNWLSVTRHERMCECGDYVTGSHVVASGSPPGVGGYRICLLCKGISSVSVIMGNSVNELPHTQNGSYILLDGTIVLVDEDIDAFMDGSLSFYLEEVA